MSRGLGRVQTIVRSMIADDPGGAWTIEQVCGRVYPQANLIEKKHRVAVLRALRRAPLPGSTWRFWNTGRKGGEYCLYDPCNDESRVRREYLSHFYRERYSYVE